MDEITVKLTRQFEMRKFADEVMHWSATSANPDLHVTGRAVATVERALRKALEKLPGWSRERAMAAGFTFVIGDAETQRRGQREPVTQDLVKQLLLGPPSTSIRDAARILAVPKATIQRIAAAIPGAGGAVRAAALTRERDLAREARTAHLPPRNRTFARKLGKHLETERRAAARRATSLWRARRGTLPL